MRSGTARQHGMPPVDQRPGHGKDPPEQVTWHSERGPWIMEFQLQMAVERDPQTYRFRFAQHSVPFHPSRSAREPDGH
jgi:hypothetical protein